MWQIKKAFDFDYGHRVHSQKLRPELALTNVCACRHLHGHRGRLWVELSGEVLNEQGMVMDFKELQFVKSVVDNYFDHKFVIDVDDPLLDVLTVGEFDEFTTRYEHGFEIGMTCDPDSSLDPEYVELLSGITVVSFVPTSENLARFFFNFASHVLEPYGVNVNSTMWEETPKSHSMYKG